jgi:hypothetical protein
MSPLIISSSPPRKGLLGQLVGASEAPGDASTANLLGQKDSNFKGHYLRDGLAALGGCPRIENLLRKR